MMQRTLLSVLSWFVGGILILQGSAFAQTKSATAQANTELTKKLETVKGFVADHCIACHDSSNDDFDLEAFDFTADQFARPEFETADWEKMLRRVSSRHMPPPDAQQPDAKAIDDFVANIAELMASRAASHPNPGRVGTIRRLTRYEYQNSIRDLLGVEINAEEFLPKDESTHGFDNITVEELSPALLNRYISASQKIARIAIGGAGRGPRGVTIRLPADQSQEEHVPGLPFGTRGGTHFNHHFHQAGEYEIEMKLMRDRDEKVEGLDRKHEIDVLLNRKQIHRFTVIPPKKGKGKDKDFTNSDAHLNTRFRVEAGVQNVGVTFPMTFSSLEEGKRQPFDANYNRHRHPRKTPALFQVSIVGPFANGDPGRTLSRQLIFGDRIDGKERTIADAKVILKQLARRAYRRPVTDADLEKPLEFFKTAAEEKGFEYGIEIAVSSILVNPNFLFKIETDENAPNERDLNKQLSQFELATRLGYFLWSSLPDETLLELAEQGKLSDPAVLEQQVQRMLADPRSSALVENFASQWLYLRNLQSITPDLRLFPDFDNNLRESFRKETELLFADVLNQKKSVLSLIDSNFTFLNQRLAKHYGISGVSGSEFRKVTLPDDSRRGGILRHGSVLMVTSYATRTSPTIRGSWILENLLGTTVPPPPPNIPNLKENSQQDTTTVRERLALHRENVACASCHDLIDPIGFSLENFDAVGRWREFADELPIDSKGVLPDGQAASSVDDLERAILARPDDFVRTVSEKLMTYSLGRSVESFDGPAIREIVGRAKSQDNRLESIITGIVLSKPFQMRRIK